MTIDVGDTPDNRARFYRRNNMERDAVLGKLQADFPDAEIDLEKVVESILKEEAVNGKQ
jgi:hypothetical protein